MTRTHYPVVVVGAGPTGVTVGTLLARYGVDTLILDRWDGIYPQPRAVHLDDEVYRIIARLGLADEFAGIARPASGLRLVNRDLTTLREFRREAANSPHGFPQANLFDQPEFEHILRTGLARHDSVTIAGGRQVTGVAHTRGGARVDYIDRVSGTRGFVHADYVLGCDGANSIIRSAIGSQMQDLGFEQRWLVVDIATERRFPVPAALDAVPGLGPKRQAALLRQFGSVRALTQADVTEIAQVPGIGPALAATISAALRTPTAADTPAQDVPS